jgi:hypothetical protein
MEPRAFAGTDRVVEPSGGGWRRIHDDVAVMDSLTLVADHGLGRR